MSNLIMMMNLMGMDSQRKKKRHSVIVFLMGLKRLNYWVGEASVLFGQANISKVVNSLLSSKSSLKILIKLISKKFGLGQTSSLLAEYQSLTIVSIQVSKILYECIATKSTKLIPGYFMRSVGNLQAATFMILDLKKFMVTKDSTRYDKNNVDLLQTLL